MGCSSSLDDINIKIHKKEVLNNKEKKIKNNKGMKKESSSKKILNNEIKLNLLNNQEREKSSYNNKEKNENNIKIKEKVNKKKYEKEYDKKEITEIKNCKKSIKEFKNSINEKKILFEKEESKNKILIENNDNDKNKKAKNIQFIVKKNENKIEENKDINEKQNLEEKKDIKKNQNLKESKDIKGSEDIKEKKDFKENYNLKDNQNNKKNNEIKDIKDIKVIKEHKDKKDNKNNKENNDLNENKENDNLKENRKNKENKYIKQNEVKERNKMNKEKKEPILIGLNNIGATCYMNATLQSLSNTNELTEYFINRYNFEPNNNKKIISNEYYKVIKNLWDIKNNNHSFSPYEFKEKLSQENPLFSGIAANDSKDLINYLLERLHFELNFINKDNNIDEKEFQITQFDQMDEKKMLKIFKKELSVNYNSIISKIFYGLLETKSQCQKCKNFKYNFQVYSFIEFPLESVNQYCFIKGKRKDYISNNNKNPDIDLYECFEYYNKVDLLEGDNQMFCNICNCLFDSFYFTLLFSVPQYLIINLYRGRGAVYECNVNFPEQLDLTNYVILKDKNTKLELYSVICHIGPSSMSGHFVSYCKNRIDNKWYLYNDGFVSLCENLYDYQKGMPYILFYQAK